MAELTEREKRLETVNGLIRIIGSHGRRFLSTNSDVREPVAEPRFSRFEFVNGRLWYIDKWRESRIFCHYDPQCRSGWGWKFSDGGTLLSLCRGMRDFIVKGAPVNEGHFGPWAHWVCGGDPWGYGKDMEIVREKAKAVLNA